MHGLVAVPCHKAHVAFAVEGQVAVKHVAAGNPPQLLQNALRDKFAEKLLAA